MRNTAFACLVCAVLSVGVAWAQDAPRRPARVVDPVELSGPPKKLPVVSPGLRAFAQSSVLKQQLDSKDPTVLAGIARDITSFIQQSPAEPDPYFLRATLSCQSGGNKDAILNDIATSAKLRAPDNSIYIYDSRDHYTLKAKVEFDLGRYQDAMGDLDASIRADYRSADQVFNDGNVKANQPTRPCVWTETDLNTLARLFPKDSRPSLYLGLYLLQHTRYSWVDADYQPILKAFEHATELNPASALAFYFSADPYLVGGIGGGLSRASSKCIDDVVPRTEPCRALDDARRTGVRFLTQAIAADPTFVVAYELRAAALYQLRESQQAIRDYNKVLELDPKANNYNDRALAEADLEDYQAAIRDYTLAIARGCDTMTCPSFENRANVYLKLHDYAHAVSDVSQNIKNYLANDIPFGINIDQFRRIYPEYDTVDDDVLCEKIRVLFAPQVTYDFFAKQFLVDTKELDDFLLPEQFLKRGDAYAKMGDLTRANAEYDRVSKGFPKWAATAFTTVNGKRVRNPD